MWGHKKVKKKRHLTLVIISTHYLEVMKGYTKLESASEGPRAGHTRFLRFSLSEAFASSARLGGERRPPGSWTAYHRPIDENRRLACSSLVHSRVGRYPTVRGALDGTIDGWINEAALPLDREDLEDLSVFVHYWNSLSVIISTDG